MAKYPLTVQEIKERSEKCMEQDKCFVSLNPLTKENILQVSLGNTWVYIDKKYKYA